MRTPAHTDREMAARLDAVEKSLADIAQQLNDFNGESHRLQRDAWTAREAAKRLGVPYTGLLALIHTGKLGYVRAGKYYLVPQFEIDRFLSDRMVKAITGSAAWKAAGGT